MSFEHTRMQMTLRAALLLAALLCLLFPTRVVCAESTAKERDQSLPAQSFSDLGNEIRAAQARLKARQTANDFMGRGMPGLAIAVAIDGRIVYEEGFGFADLEQRVPVWPSTKFRIGSVSKPLTAVGLMRLVEAGKLDLDAPVQKYVPQFPDKGSPITARMLAGHLAGIRHYRGDEMKIRDHYMSVVDGLKVFSE